MPKRPGQYMQTRAEKEAAALKKKRELLRKLKSELEPPPPEPVQLSVVRDIKKGTKAKEPKAPKEESKAITILPEIASSEEQVEAAALTEKRMWKFGRVPMYLYPNDMEPIIRQFFLYCIEKGQPPLLSSLSLALGFASKHTFDDYLKKPEFHDLLTRAKLVCEDFAAKGLLSGKNTVGFIFLLKQYGWRDVHENVVTYETHEQRIARLIKANNGGER